MSAPNTLRRRYDLAVTTANSRTVAEFQIDRTIQRIHGVALSSDRDDLLYFRGAQSIEIDGLEIFPAEYESKLLVCGISLSPNARFFKTELDPGNGQLRISYFDTDHPNTTFAPYRVSVYLEAEK